MYAPDGAGEGADAGEDQRNVPEDGPSGENTVNDGERGGGLWTSGGVVTSGTPYNDEYGKPGPNRSATPEPGTENEEK